MRSAIRAWVACLGLLSAPTVQAAPVPDLPGEWARLTTETAEMGLPSRFLRLLPLEFVKLEFADLKNVAAEYHPDGHRMVFHLHLSEGNQGKRLRSLRQVGNHDLATIYHELFHAYFDYVDFASGTPRMTPQGARLYAEAKRFAACRYAVVEVSPISAQQNAPGGGGTKSAGSLSAKAGTRSMKPGACSSGGQFGISLRQRTR